MKIIIEVRGGTIQNISASNACEIEIVDWDNIREDLSWNEITELTEEIDAAEEFLDDLVEKLECNQAFVDYSDHIGTFLSTRKSESEEKTADKE